MSAVVAPVSNPGPVAPAPVPVQVHEPSPVETAAAAAVSAAPTVVVVSSEPSPVPAPAVVHQVVVPGPTVAQVAKVVASKPKKKKSPVTVTMATAASAQANGQGAQGENTGRWTAEEHNLFLQGLEQHGKGWKKIANLIKSRTVVQIRTHAQKYFQKLAKARQNGEEGEVSMEGRGPTPVSAVTLSPTQANKRRRQTSGTKRKTVPAAVPGVPRPAKKPATGQTAIAAAPLPSVAPVLSPYGMPQSTHTETISTQALPAVPTSAGVIAGPVDDSLFRFLGQPSHSEGHVNEVARQAGANPITVPQVQNGVAPGGEGSPTGVADLTMYPSWTDAKDTPSWYAKGSDVDALLDVTDTDALEWLADAGDIDDTYDDSPNPVEQPPSIPDLPMDKPMSGMTHTPSVNNMNTLSQVEECVGVEIPPLPSLFDGEASAEPSHKYDHQLPASVTDSSLDDHLQVFENPMEEHDFVTSMLEPTDDGPVLPILQ